MWIPPARAFLVDQLPSGAIPSYNVERDVTSLFWEDGVREFSGSRIIIPTAPPHPDPDGVAWKLLLRAAAQGDPVHLFEVERAMRDRDLVVDGFVRRDGIVLAVDRSCTGTRALVRDEEGWILHNPPAVVRVEASEGEWAVWEVMTC